MNIKRGQIYYANLSSAIGSEQGGLRPVLIVQNDIGNRHSPTTIICPITSKLTKHKLPTHVEIDGEGCGLLVKSVILCEQIKTIDKQRLRDRLYGELSKADMARVDKALRIGVGV